jgi:glycosyltransferase involved in cell wall biosynthesis
MIGDHSASAADFDYGRGAPGFRGSALEGRTILQVVPRLDAGGAEQTTLDIAAALVEAGARAVVASEGGRLVGDLQARGGIFVPFPAATKNPIAMARGVGRLRALIEREHVDLVHARSRAPAWVALGACRAADVPLVTTYHGAYSGRSAIKLQYNSVMVRGNVVIANSLFTARLIAKIWPETAPRIATIARGIDLRAFSAESIDADRARRLREKWGVPPDARVILVPARLVRRKGHLLMVEAARRLKAGGQNGLVFVFAGHAEGHDSTKREIEKAAAAAGMADHILCVGHCDDMPAAYLAAAITVVPSVEPETFGRVSVEAQAMGVPVVVTDLGAAVETVLAPPEVAPAGRTGWRVKPGDAEALADGITAALSLGAAARDALAARARAHVAGRFALERMTAATLDVYERLLDHHARRRAGP